MRVNTVDFTAGTYKVPTVPLGKKNRIAPIKHETNMKAADIIPITGLLGACLMSVYFIKKGNLDVGMRSIKI